MTSRRARPARRAAGRLAESVGLIIVASVLLVAVVEASMGSDRLPAGTAAVGRGGTAGGTPDTGVRAEVIVAINAFSAPTLRLLDPPPALPAHAISAEQAVAVALKEERASSGAIGVSLAYQTKPWLPPKRASRLVWVVELRPDGIGMRGGTRHVPAAFVVEIIDARTGRWVGGVQGSRLGVPTPGGRRLAR
jgi:hypothetical protein